MFSSSKDVPRRLEKWLQFRTQQTALSGGFLLMLSSGIHIGHGFFAWENVSVEWTQSVSSTMIAFAAASWFMGGIFGFTLAPATIKHKKQKIYVSLSKVL